MKINATARDTGGFTLIELMIVLTIVAIVITVGAPSLSEFAASQRIRTAVSDATADISFARAEAIKESRQVIMEQLAGATGTWKDGWRTCVDFSTPSNGICDATDQVRKITQPLSGRIKACPVGGVTDRIIFRPDGRAARLSGAAITALGTNDGLKVSDDLGDGAAGNDYIRSIVIGVSGRPVVIKQDGGTAGGTVCP